MPLTPEQIATVKSTAPIVKEYGGTITSVFYKNMLTAHPELKNYFSLRNQQGGLQQAALATAVFAYASYIDDLPKLTHAVERIAHKHASLFIKADQYAIVGKYLVGAFAEVLGSALTPEIADAWIAAYGQLADVFIKREQQLYDDAGDWQSWRKFKIAQKDAETDDIVSLYLEPEDGKPLPSFKAGQYVSIQLALPELDGLLQSRQFSLSVAPTSHMKQYRVSVKQEKSGQDFSVEDLAAGKVAGIISNRLFHNVAVGDLVELSPPRGEFFFDPAATKAVDSPIVLLCLGVGATPLVSILDSILSSDNAARPVTWAQAAGQSNAVCFGKHVRDIAASAATNGSNLKTAVFVKNVEGGDKQGVDYDFEGTMTVDRLASEGVLHLDNEAAEYFMCGAEEWMVETRAALEGKGVPRERIHLELFRTGDV